ncbi:DUF1190 domain-containing protein [Meridianimarinicoccus sp. RP-17]|uniref:DUF1190 domain-containing protein n=1 Tax=Meridianimarinicoccus zhengii TaxID=2056810 RepID=UPI000DAC8FA2|nr:DUF1190 domain-containing protein [Phycocomes zhengii]
MVLGTYFPLDIDSLTQLPQIERARHLEKHGVCEEQHGVGNFGGEDATGWAGVITAGTGGGGIFLPLMAGYMMGNMMSSGAQSGFASCALYPTAGGAVATANGASFARTGVITSTAASTFTRPAAITAGQPPMTRATVARTGGFGGSMTTAGG